MNVGSLFAGIGGFDLGLERAGFEIKWQVERNEWCQQILKKHWPNTELTSSVEDFLASLSAVPVNDAEQTTNAGCGQSSYGAFAYYDRDSCSWKTCQASFLPDSRTCSVDWPRAGTMRNGIVFQQESCSATNENACYLWPTPLARDWKDGFSPVPHGKHSPSLPVKLGGHPHPEFYEELMGFPVGYTEYKHSAMPSSRKSQNGSGNKS